MMFGLVYKSAILLAFPFAHDRLQVLLLMYRELIKPYCFRISFNYRVVLTHNDESYNQLIRE